MNSKGITRRKNKQELLSLFDFNEQKKLSLVELEKEMLNDIDKNGLTVQHEMNP
jgi:hypothetical protein